jgi:thiamine-phosphate diphosphorylase
VAPIIGKALDAGFTCIQIRSKTASAAELTELTRQAALAIASRGLSDKVALLVNDRLDVALAARQMGVKVDGVHVGQSDIPANVCRHYLGEDSIVGLSARTQDLFDYVRTADVSAIDYFGAGPLRETHTKPDCGLGDDGKVVARSLDEITALAKASPIPIVVGGGVKLADIPGLARTGTAGFFVVSAVTEAEDPARAAASLAQAWSNAHGKRESAKLGLRKIRGAIFDLDGTLFDSMPVWDTVGADYLRSMGAEPRDGLRSITKKMTLREVAVYFKDDYRIERTVPEIEQGINKLLEHYYTFEAPLKDGSRELLEIFRSRGVRMCVLTATERYLTEAALSRCGLLDLFEFVMTCAEFGTGKDTPEIFEKALAMLGTEKELTYVFEDAPHAMQTANAAGFPVVAVRDNAFEYARDEIIRSSDLFVENPAEIAALYRR